MAGQKHSTPKYKIILHSNFYEPNRVLNIRIANRILNFIICCYWIKNPKTVYFIPYRALWEHMNSLQLGNLGLQKDQPA